MHTIFAVGIGNMRHFSSATGGAAEAATFRVLKALQRASVLLFQANAKSTTIFGKVSTSVTCKLISSICCRQQWSYSMAISMIAKALHDHNMHKLSKAL